MTRKNVWILAMSMAIGMLWLASCKSKKDSAPSCEEAMDSLYSAGCAVAVSDLEISEDEAVNGCEDAENDAEDLGCIGERKDLLRCLEEIEECDDCDSEWIDYNGCMAGTGGGDADADADADSDSDGSSDVTCSVDYCDDVIRYCEIAVDRDYGDWSGSPLQECVDVLVGNYALCGLPANIASCVADCAEENTTEAGEDFCYDDHECGWFGDCPT